MQQKKRSSERWVSGLSAFESVSWKVTDYKTIIADRASLCKRAIDPIRCVLAGGVLRRLESLAAQGARIHMLCP